MSKDLYNVLDVSRDASADDIKKAFRKLAHKYHPDKENGDEAKFKEVNSAYQILGDEEKRKHYDQFGDAAFQNGGAGFGGGGFGAQGMNFDFGDLGDLGDLFGGMFGGGGRSRRKPKGHDIELDITIDFKEMAFGKEETIAVRKLEPCDSCYGTGAKDGKVSQCAHCNGAGVERVVRRTPLGAMQTTVACTKCDGRGETADTQCGKCAGASVNRQQVEMNVRIPAGIESGQMIRARGKGDAAPNGGEPGDMYIRIFVKDHASIKRDGDLLRSDAKIGFTQAALGASIAVETVDGKVEMKIPEGTQSGEELRLKGKGMQKSRGRGDHIVTIQVVTPTKLSRKQRKQLDDLDLKA